MISVAEIAGLAFDGVSGAISGVVKSASLTKITGEGTYNADTGQYDGRLNASTTGRAVFDTSTPIEDIFPAYTIGPEEVLVYLEGMEFAPTEEASLLIDGVEYEIKTVTDIVMAGGLYAAVVV